MTLISKPGGTRGKDEKPVANSTMCVEESNGSGRLYRVASMLRCY